MASAADSIEQQLAGVFVSGYPSFRVVGRKLLEDSIPVTVGPAVSRVDKIDSLTYPYDSGESASQYALLVFFDAFGVERVADLLYK